MSSLIQRKSTLLRFRSFEEAFESQNQEAYRRGFDVDRVRLFLDQAQTRQTLRMKPALYRFKTFDELHLFDENQLIQMTSR